MNVISVAIVLSVQVELYLLGLYVLKNIEMSDVKVLFVKLTN